MKSILIDSTFKENIIIDNNQFLSIVPKTGPHNIVLDSCKISNRLHTTYSSNNNSLSAYNLIDIL